MVVELDEQHDPKARQDEVLDQAMASSGRRQLIVE
jgi:hypothetical protein